MVSELHDGLITFSTWHVRADRTQYTAKARTSTLSLRLRHINSKTVEQKAKDNKIRMNTEIQYKNPEAKIYFAPALENLVTDFVPSAIDVS